MCAEVEYVGFTDPLGCLMNIVLLRSTFKNSLFIVSYQLKYFVVASITLIVLALTTRWMSHSKQFGDELLC